MKQIIVNTAKFMEYWALNKTAGLENVEDPNALQAPSTG